jgi:hypothetical protein
VLTLVLAIMISGALMPAKAHAGTDGGTCEYSQGQGNQYFLGVDIVAMSLACGFYTAFDAVTETVHDLWWGASELLWEGLYGAGCGFQNLYEWDGESCEMSVADAGVQHRNALNDWAGCIAAFDPTPFGLIGAVITADGEEEIAAHVQGVIESKVIDGSEQAVKDFMRSKGVIQALAANDDFQGVFKRVPKATGALMIYAIGTACFNDVTRSLSNVVLLDRGLDHNCAFAQTPTYSAADCKENGFSLVVQGNIDSCIDGGEGFGWGVNIPSEGVTGPRYLEGDDAQDLCERVILPEAIRRGLVDDDDITLVEGLIPKAPPPTIAELQPAAVPGGSTNGACSDVLRAMAEGTATGIDSKTKGECTGTNDVECQRYRARAAVGLGAPSSSSRAQAVALEKRCM